MPKQTQQPVNKQNAKMDYDLLLDQMPDPMAAFVKKSQEEEASPTHVYHATNTPNNGVFPRVEHDGDDEDSSYSDSELAVEAVIATAEYEWNKRAGEDIIALRQEISTIPERIEERMGDQSLPWKIAAGFAVGVIVGIKLAK